MGGAGQRSFCREGEGVLGINRAGGAERQQLPCKSPTLFFCRRLTARLWDAGRMGIILGSAAKEHPLIEKRICWALPPNLCPVSPLLPCPQQEDGFCSNRGREGVSCGGGAAGCRQHHYSGEAPVLGSMGVRVGGVTAPHLSISVSSP